MNARYATAFAAILWTTAFSAVAGPTYQMVGGICTDGGRTDIGGPLLCSHNITVIVEMVDGYVPGTPFFETSEGSEPSSVAFFTFDDGAEFISTDFPLGVFGVGNSGAMPGLLDIRWFEGFFFHAEGGTWQLGFEGGPPNVGCGPAYCSSGTYETWVLVPEPQSLALVGVALLVFVRSRRNADAPPSSLLFDAAQGTLQRGGKES